jgi:hypothetical protein
MFTKPNMCSLLIYNKAPMRFGLTFGHLQCYGVTRKRFRLDEVSH